MTIWRLTAVVCLCLCAAEARSANPPVKAYPDGQLRGIGCAVPKAKSREEGLKEITENLDKLKACRLNTLFVWTESLYAASTCTGFVIRLRQMLLAKRPRAWLSANGSTGTGADADWRIGRDWVTWARRGYIDFYVPQIYTNSVEDFYKGGLKTRELLGTCDLITGFAVSWSGIYPARQAPEVIREQIRAAANLGAKGFVVYHLDHFQDKHFEAIREAVRCVVSRPSQ